MKLGLNPAASGLLGGMTGGIVQAYATMGGCLNLASVQYLIELELLNY